MKRLLISCLVALPALMLAPRESSAADHYDMFEDKNPVGGQDPSKLHDIVDLFAFPSATTGKLVLIMNTDNRAHPDTLFSNAIYYSFRMRTGATREAGKEYRITCKFNDIEEGRAPTQTGTCTAFSIEGGKATPIKDGATNVTVNNEKGGSVPNDEQGRSNPNLKAFAGVRADAFFGDAIGLFALVKTRVLAFPGKALNSQPIPRKAVNLTEQTNDLSIVLEVDTKALGIEGSVFRVAAETATKKSSSGVKGK